MALTEGLSKPFYMSFLEDTQKPSSTFSLVRPLPFYRSVKAKSFDFLMIYTDFTVNIS